MPVMSLRVFSRLFFWEGFANTYITCFLFVFCLAPLIILKRGQMPLPAPLNETLLQYFIRKSDNSCLLDGLAKADRFELPNSFYLASV